MSICIHLVLQQKQKIKHCNQLPFFSDLFYLNTYLQDGQAEHVLHPLSLNPRLYSILRLMCKVVLMNAYCFFLLCRVIMLQKKPTCQRIT